MNSQQPILLSLIVPAYNEAERIGPGLGRLRAYLDGAFPGSEIVVVDDGSTDGTRAVVEAMAASDPAFVAIHFPSNRGKGAAVREGMLRARGQFRIFSDADLSTPVEEIARAIDLLRHGADLVIGTRAGAGSQVLVAQRWPRKFLGQCFNRLVRALTGLRHRDTQCGFKGFSARAAEAIFLETREDGFAADVEMLLLAQRLRLSVVELPVRWTNVPDSRVHLVRDPAKMLVGLLKIWMREAKNIHEKNTGR